MDEKFKEFLRGEAWKEMQKYALRRASDPEQSAGIWCPIAEECERKFQYHQKKLKELTKKPKS